MKLTDLAIVFEVFLICLVTVLHMRSEIFHAQTVNDIMYNNVMDNIVEDSLRAGFVSIGSEGVPVVDITRIKQCFEAENELYNQSYRHILIYTDEEGYYVWDDCYSDAFDEKIFFKDDSHERKVQELIQYLEDTYNVRLYIPVNDGEGLMNTIEDYSLLAISLNADKRIRCFSGAMIYKDEERTVQ